MFDPILVQMTFSLPLSLPNVAYEMRIVHTFVCSYATAVPLIGYSDFLYLYDVKPTLKMECFIITLFEKASWWTKIGKESVLMTQDWLKRALNRPKLGYVLIFAVFVENYLIDFAEMFKNERINFWLIDWCSWFYDWFLLKERSQYR